MEWQLRHQNLYRIYTPTEDDLSVLRGYVLVETDEDGVVEDTMRVAVHGETAVKVSFKSEVLILSVDILKNKGTIANPSRRVNPRETE